MSAANMPPADVPSGSWATVEPPTSRPTGYAGAYSRTTYQPTAEQLIRDEARRRYLRRNVYAPLGVAVAIVAAAFLLVVVLAIFRPSPQVASLIAGMAAFTIIFFSIPLIALMAIAPIAWLALALNRRQRRRDFPEYGPMAYRSRLQILLWQLDGLLDGVGIGVEQVAVRLRRPLIRLHTWTAYWRGWLRGIRS
jgi:hypothetical protein